MIITPGVQHHSTRLGSSFRAKRACQLLFRHLPSTGSRASGQCLRAKNRGARDHEPCVHRRRQHTIIDHVCFDGYISWVSGQLRIECWDSLAPRCRKVSGSVDDARWLAHYRCPGFATLEDVGHSDVER